MGIWTVNTFHQILTLPSKYPTSFHWNLAEHRSKSEHSLSDVLLTPRQSFHANDITKANHHPNLQILFQSTEGVLKMLPSVLHRSRNRLCKEQISHLILFARTQSNPNYSGWTFLKMNRARMPTSKAGHEWASPWSLCTALMRESSLLLDLMRIIVWETVVPGENGKKWIRIRGVGEGHCALRHRCMMVYYYGRYDSLKTTSKYLSAKNHARFLHCSSLGRKLIH